jgi:hypothetical protein
MSRESEYLLDIARRHAARYVAHLHPTAILLAGSAATDDVDGYADVDLICYYEAMPPEAQFRAVWEHWHEATGVRHGPWSAAGLGEHCTVGGVEVQIGHFPIDVVERDVVAVTEAFNTDAVLHKKVLGLLEGLPLHGGDTIARWQARLAAYPDGLARAMVEQHLRGIFPVWYYREHLARRDAALWQQQALVEAALHILGVVAGLNRRYYSSVELKRTRRLVTTLPIAPAHLVARLEALLTGDRTTAVEQVEAIVREVIALVERHLPGADTTVLRRQPGEREQAWAVLAP